ncbi:MAG: flagellin FliC [Proteobacteria bacterium]|nr:flagellin FliC [Pseudomonadota bacterium]
MALIINTNVPSLLAQQNLETTSKLLLLNVQRLSSGLRINSAADDAAGLARADQLKAQSRAIQAALRNSNDGVSTLEIADKSSEKITELLVRMTELAASAAQGTLDDQTRGYYSDEYDALASEIDRITATTEFGGTKLLDGAISSINIQIGFRDSSSDRLTIALANVTSTSLGIAAGDLASQGSAQAAITLLDTALVKVNDARASFGAQTTRLNTTIANLSVTFTNFQAAESRIRDADFAIETAQFTKNQILIQSGVSVLTQANTLPQSALSLLT